MINLYTAFNNFLKDIAQHSPDKMNALISYIRLSMNISDCENYYYVGMYLHVKLKKGGACKEFISHLLAIVR